MVSPGMRLSDRLAVDDLNEPFADDLLVGKTVPERNEILYSLDRFQAPQKKKRSPSLGSIVSFLVVCNWYEDCFEVSLVNHHPATTQKNIVTQKT